MNKYQEAWSEILSADDKVDGQWTPRVRDILLENYKGKDFSKYVHLIQELLELSVPKKVTREVIGMITHVQCPTCKRVMRHETSGAILKFCTNHKHCSVCGQALDWSKDE